MDAQFTAAAISPAASPLQAAAIMAAIEQFSRDTAPVLAAGPPPVSAWRQAALHEGVRRAPEVAGTLWDQR